jgi:D-alanyl-D-alanine carboxypeptidase
VRARVIVALVSILFLSLACQQSYTARRSLLGDKNGAQATGTPLVIVKAKNQVEPDDQAPTAIAGANAVAGEYKSVEPGTSTKQPLLSTATAVPPQPPDWTAPVDAALQAVMDRSSLPLAGLSVAVRVGDQPPVTFAYGRADIASGLPVDADTPFQVASITKQFTAAAILQLMEAGKLSLDDPAVHFFPDLPDDIPAAAQAITISHLLTHTSGLPDPVGWKFRDFMLDQPIPDGDSQVDLAGAFGSPNATPGAVWSYNNTGYWILGRIVEIVSGQSYGDYLQTHFFTPLGMPHTSYCPDPPPGQAIGYNYDSGAQQLQPVKGDMRLAFSAGGICSTSTDLLTWQQALSSGLVVRPATYQQMITPVQLNDGSTHAYGFGLVVNGQGDQQVVSHSGILCGFQSVLVHYARGNVTIAVLINTDQSQSAPNIASAVIFPLVQKR